MGSVVSFFIGGFCGVILGFFLTALLVAGRDDRP